MIKAKALETHAELYFIMIKKNVYPALKLEVSKQIKKNVCPEFFFNFDQLPLFHFFMRMFLSDLVKNTNSI